MFAASTRSTLREEPQLEVVYDELVACAGLRTAQCPEQGLHAAARWFTRLISSCATGLTPSEGEPCDEGGCGSGLRCTATSAEMCGSCEAAPLGWCSSDAHCSTDAYCNAETEQCLPIVELGQACGTSQECRSGECRDEICALEAQLGEPCSGGSDCAAFLECVDGSCQDAPGEGEACTDPGDCRYAFSCIDGMCRSLSGEQPLGGPCQLIGDDCGGSAYCDLVERTCRSNEVGAPCNASCGTKRRCVGGACAPLLAEGQVCGHDTECDSSRCFDGACAGRLSCLD